jgi:hypothetical protein
MDRVKRAPLFFSLLALGVSLAAGDQNRTVDSFIARGLVEGQLKSMYYTIDKENADDSYATAVGGYLKYTTDKKNLLYGSVRFHTSNPIGSSQNPASTHLFDNDNDASAFVANSEAYLALHSEERILKVGNLMLATPMMNEDKTRIVPWSYQGAAYTGTALPHTKVQLFHIKKIRSFTSSSYTRESASGEIGDKGITMLGVHYNGIHELELKSYYYYAPDLYSTFIAQADYKHSLSEQHFFCLGAQYFKSGHGGIYNQTDNKNGGDDIDLIALKASFDTPNWKVGLNYSRNFGISGIVKGYGGLAKVYTTSMIANGRGNYEPETWMLKIVYDLPPSDWGESDLALTLTNTRAHREEGNDFDAVYVHWRHQFDADAMLYLRYERLHYYSHDKGNESFFRIIASYEF